MLLKQIVAAACRRTLLLPLLAPVFSFAQAAPVLSEQQIAAVAAQCAKGCVILSKEQADQLQEQINELARKAFLAGTKSCKKDLSL